jgi:hypothetical protein
MVAAARRLGGRSPARYEQVRDLRDLPRSDVVSATSLLCQAGDAGQALDSLWAAVLPGGTLLVLETTSAITPRRISRASHHRDPWSRCVLGAWARARAGRAIDPAVYRGVPAEARIVPLLDGCAELRIFANGS